MALHRAAVFAVLLAGFNGMAITKDLRGDSLKVKLRVDSGGNSTRGDPKPILVLRLSHTGSSWLTAMIAVMNDTYITREGIVAYENYNKHQVLISKTASDLSTYIKTALRVPSGNILGKPIQLYSYENADVIECLKKYQHECRLKYVGLTMDPIGVNSGYRDEVYSEVSKAYPNLPVLMYRRTNVVKHALAKGGMDAGAKDYRAKSVMDPDEFLQLVRQAVEDDHALVSAGAFFNNMKILRYEQLQEEAVPLMNDVLEFFGMPRNMTEQLADQGGKKSSENLRDIISNFDQLEAILTEKSPCLARQFRSANVEVFDEQCSQI